MKRISPYIALIFALSLQASVSGQYGATDYKVLMQMPPQYAAAYTSDIIHVDGRGDEKAWMLAPWIDNFVDITTGNKLPGQPSTRCKMLWDDQHLYIYAEFQEDHLRATISENDTQVFMDNAFEIFINPDGSGFNYFELQINALATTWDLFLPRPYRAGGRGLTSWDAKGWQKAVHLSGTLNNPADKDTGWSVEMAIPFASLGVFKGLMQDGTIWRMNLSRVQWQTEVVDGQYRRTTDKETRRFSQPQYMVWSPQGLVDLHYPEKWGYVLFDRAARKDTSFLVLENEKLKLRLWRYYYLQQLYLKHHKRYAANTEMLDKMEGHNIPVVMVPGSAVTMFATEKQFWIEGKNSNGFSMAIDQEGEVHSEKKQSNFITMPAKNGNTNL